MIDHEAREFAKSYPPASRFLPAMVYGRGYNRAVVENLRSAQSANRCAAHSARPEEFYRIEKEYLAAASRYLTV